MQKGINSTWAKLAMTLAIVVVLNVFINSGLYLFYPQPQYDEICAESVKMDNEYYQKYPTEPLSSDPERAAFEKERMDKQVSCNEAYEAAREEHGKFHFIILTIAGLVSFMCGMLIISLPSAILNGLLYGGVVSIFIGTTVYWADMHEILRFVLSGIALLILIALGAKKLRD